MGVANGNVGNSHMVFVWSLLISSSRFRFQLDCRSAQLLFDALCRWRLAAILDWHNHLGLAAMIGGLRRASMMKGLNDEGTLRFRRGLESAFSHYWRHSRENLFRNTIYGTPF